MAFGGVATGSINASEQASEIPKENRNGFNPKLTDSDIIIGIKILAVAVFEVSSVAKMTKVKATK